MQEPQKNHPQVHVETWGCQMNVADSEQAISLLKDAAFQPCSAPEQADVIILNTCHIREKAYHKMASRLGVLRQLKQRPTLVVAGCVAQAEGKKLLKKIPSIDVLVGPGQIRELPQLLRQHADSGQQQWALGFDKKPGLVKTTPMQGRTAVSRFLNIQQGCNNFCTFCVVPLTRGREQSIPPAKIFQHAQDLVAQGAKEITLLGQNVNSYGLDLDKYSFVDLLREVASIENLKRLRFTTSNPHDLSFELAALFKEIPKLGSYYHLPIQSASDRILAAMKRKVDIATYLEKISWLRQAKPGIALSTDIIVGFPGESETDFQATLDLLEKVQYSFVYAFKYSPRPKTAAARFTQQVSEEVKTQRLKQLNYLQDEITRKLNAAECGKTREVLVLYQSKKEDNVYYGRTPEFRLVRIAAARDICGQILPVEIIASNKTALEGKIV